MEDIILNWTSIHVESKIRPIEGPKFIFPYFGLWRLEYWIRKLLHRPAPKVPYRFTIGKPIICMNKSLWKIMS